MELSSCWVFSWAVRNVILRFARNCVSSIFPCSRARSIMWIKSSSFESTGSLFENFRGRFLTRLNKRSSNSFMIANARRRDGNIMGYLSSAGKLKNKGLNIVRLMMLCRTSMRMPGFSKHCDFRVGQSGFPRAINILAHSLGNQYQESFPP